MKTPTNPSSIKTRFAIKFLQAMKKLNKKRSSSPSMADKQRRCRLIRAAACASMASAVGTRRAWSRAVLRKTVNNHQYHSVINNRRRITRRKRVVMMRRGNPREGHSGNLGEEDDILRGLVPGGEGMDFCRLLSETAHYVKCLRAQIQVMTNILDHYST
ncbi:hypothetical protein CDL12_20958 [Handroanthus impetiginosus]|uniref:IBH1-like N-terminal domain-containing protein n=1 Tax=Handroanthus impetiginosus TaxID=429701 RepID=A0A2G9GMK7_9LAMI|nr:hypothetical protein CDL12_20958 [Handroanthus impetiginosus]